MKKNIILCLFICIVGNTICANPFAYDAAAHILQKGEWDKAYEMLAPLVMDNPDNATLLYDAGIAAYKMQKYPQAITHFIRSAQHAHNDHLKMHAYFNAGNASVETKELRKAIEYYDAVLAIDPEHEYAKHNKERVLEMLQQQEQKEHQQQGDNEKNDQNNQDQSDKEENKENQNQDDQQGNSDNKKDNSSKQKNENKQDDSSESGQNSDSNQNDADKQSSSRDKSEKQSDQKERTDNSNSSNSNERKNDRNEEQHTTDSNDDKKRDSDHQSQQKSNSQHDESNGQQSNNHDEAPQKQNDDTSVADSSTVTSDEHKEQDAKKQEEVNEASYQGKEEMLQALNEKLQDPLLMSILQKQEERDKAANRQLMQTKIQQNGGKDGQNCW